MTQAQGEEVILLSAQAKKSKVSEGKEDMERERGDHEGGGDAGQHQGHPLVSLPLPRLSFSIKSKSRIVLKKLQNLEFKTLKH